MVTLFASFRDVGDGTRLVRIEEAAAHPGNG